MKFTRDLTLGIRSYIDGLYWLKERPRYFFFLLIPFLLGFLLITSGWALFIHEAPLLFARLFGMVEPKDFGFESLVFHATKGVFYIMGIAIATLVALLIVSILTAPLYDWVSLSVERQLGLAPVIGDQRHGGWRSKFPAVFQAVKEEGKKTVFIALASLLLLMVPLLNILTLLLTAFLIGWNFYDYPMARRGMRFRQRLAYGVKDFWKVLGLGLWLMIPIVQIFLLPFAIVGGTLLAVRTLEAKASNARVI